MVLLWRLYSYPYIGWAICIGLGFAIFALRTKNPLAKVVSVNLAIFLCFFGLLEAGASLFKHEVHGRGPAYVSPDDILGYVPRQGATVQDQAYLDGKLIYHVVYSFDKDGLRITPSFKGQGCRDAVLFFGCSFTFGEGLNDEETMPFLVSQGAKTQVYNFGFSGYGPHQMLSAIENGLVALKVECNPKYAIYQTGFFHVARSAGESAWDHHGPKYILNPDGKIKFAGHFDDPPMIRMINGLVDRSATYKNLISQWNLVTKGDVERYLAIVLASKNDLLKRYPGLEFHVIFWDYKAMKGSPELNWGVPQEIPVLEGLQQEGIRVHRVSDILPGYERYNDYHLPDGHPNAAANKYIADYITQHILQKK